MNPSHIDRQMTLQDGRSLAWAEYGDASGDPLFAFHGTPGARNMIRVIDAVARDHGVRIIAPDRPGFGRSDFLSTRTLLDWPDDVASLADHLGLGRFAVAGVSGGGPYALACAYRLPHRVTTVGVVSGLGPVIESGLKAALLRAPMASLLLLQRAPSLLRAVTASVAFGVRRFPDKVFQSLLLVSSESDRAVLQRAVVRNTLLEAFEEAFAQGVEGVSHEIALFGRAWEFDLAAITAPVHLWHGESDGQVPVAMGRYMAQRLPQCRARFVPHAGHYWIFDHQAELLAALFPRPS